MNWLFRIIVALALLAFAAFGYIAYPVSALDRVWAAAKVGDLAALETLVDWPSVRAGFRSDISSEMFKLDASRSYDLPMLRSTNAGAADNFVEGLITPDVFSKTIRNVTAAGDPYGKFERNIRFTGPTNFVATFTTPEAPGVLEVILTLSGPNWRVTRVRSPLYDTVFSNKLFPAPSAKPQ